MQARTLNDVFFAIVDRRLERTMLTREATNRWLPISSRELYDKVAGLARTFRKWGVLKGERIAVLSENRPEWAITDFAALFIGAVTVPIYATLTPDQTAYILADSGAKVVVVSGSSQLEKVMSIKHKTGVQHVVIMDPVATPDAIQIQTLIREGLSYPEPIDHVARSIAPSDLASIIYTSGTTGTSKGVQLTHGNLTSNILHSMLGFEVGPGDTSVSFLPLSHVTARHVDFALLLHGVTLAYCPFIDHLPQVLTEIRPTIFVGVPRVYEKIYAQVDQKVKGKTRKQIYRWALAIGRDHCPEILAGRKPSSAAWKLADRIIFSKVLARMGGRVRLFVSGGAPLGKELAQWYADIGICIHEGYGLTETSPVIAINNSRSKRLGSVGQVLPNLQVRIAEDGEILVRGPSVFRSYWNRPEETRDAFIDGWFKTGDIGNIDEDGFLSVTDRKKDLLKTSGGKFIAPQPVENSLKLNAMIGAAVVVGDRRKFPSVLISPHFPLLESWARENDIAFTSKAHLVAHPKVRVLYEGIVEEVNQNLARFEKLKKVLLVPDEFTTTDGSLTPTLKLRRKVIEERYRQQIEDLYRQSEMSNVA